MSRYRWSESVIDPLQLNKDAYPIVEGHLRESVVEEIHSKFTDRRPNGFLRIGLGITMSLKWIQGRVKRLVGLLERESAAPAYFRVARTLCIDTLIRGEKLYWYGSPLAFRNCVYCNLLTDFCRYTRTPIVRPPNARK